MKKIYNDFNKLLHIIYRKDDIINERDVIIDDNNFIQCISMKLNKGKTFKPHKHIYHELLNNNVIAQESWVIISGSVKFIYYDEDNTMIGSDILYPGDISITLFGGHNYEILEDNTLIYEYKTGPYLGVELDKELI